MQHAKITEGFVETIILADAEFIAQMPGEWVDCTGKECGVGWLFDGVDFHAPVPPALPADPRLWWIDTGPWKDRFDIHGYPGLKNLVLALGRTNDTCYAANADLVGRVYIDLVTRRAELAAALEGIAAAVEAAGEPAFTPAMQTAMLDSPTTDQERYIKGLAA